MDTSPAPRALIRDTPTEERSQRKERLYRTSRTKVPAPETPLNQTEEHDPKSQGGNEKVGVKRRHLVIDKGKPFQTDMGKYRSEGIQEEIGHH